MLRRPVNSPARRGQSRHKLIQNDRARHYGFTFAQPPDEKSSVPAAPNYLNEHKREEFDRVEEPHTIVGNDIQAKIKGISSLQAPVVLADAVTDGVPNHGTHLDPEFATFGQACTDFDDSVETADASRVDADSSKSLLGVATPKSLRTLRLRPQIEVLEEESEGDG
jgi:hypothetical protein